MMRAATPLALVVLLYVAVPAASASPARWEGNGHLYEAVPVAGGLTWDQATARADGAAFEDAEGTSYVGHLATIASAEENEFIRANCPGAAASPGYWLGGYQQPGSPEPDGGWCWVTDEPFDYANWASGEPNNNSGGNPEEKLHFANAAAQWNDVPAAAVLGGYVIEYEPDGENAPPVADAGGPYQAEATGVLVDVQPSRLNPAGNGRWVTAYIVTDPDAVAQVQLDGTGSQDPDGDELSFSWTVLDGEGATVATAEGAEPSVELAPGSYTAELTVSDGVTDPDTASASIEVAGVDLGAIEPTWVTLCGPGPGSPARGEQGGVNETGALEVKFSRSVLMGSLVPGEENTVVLDGAVQGEDTVDVMAAPGPQGTGNGEGSGKGRTG